VGVKRKYKFRFRNSLLEPYIIMKGIADGQVRSGLIDGLSAPELSPDSPRSLFERFE
jgi:hypothetical protein